MKFKWSTCERPLILSMVSSPLSRWVCPPDLSCLHCLCHAYPCWQWLPLLPTQGEPGLLGDEGPMGLPVSAACLLACPYCQHLRIAHLHRHRCHARTTAGPTWAPLEGQPQINVHRLFVDTCVWVCTHQMHIHWFYHHLSVCYPPLAPISCCAPHVHFRGHLRSLSHVCVFLWRCSLCWVYPSGFYWNYQVRLMMLWSGV